MIFGRENSYFGSNIEASVAEGYNDHTGAIRALIDSVTEETQIFESLIINDFKEAYALHNPDMVTESEIIAIQEAGVGDFLKKIKDFLVKCWEKIKAIFKSFWDYLRAIFTKNNKDLVDKFKKQVLEKDLSKMKVKYCKEKTSKKFWASAEKFTSNTDDINSIFNKVKNSGKTISDLSYYEENSDKTKLCESICKEQLNGIRYDEFDKEFSDDCFETEEEVTGFTDSDMRGFIKTLSEGDKKVSDLKKVETNINKWYTNVTRMLDNAEKDINKLTSNDISDKSYVDKYQSKFNVGPSTGGTDDENVKHTKDNLNIIVKYLYSYATSINDIQNKCIRNMIEATKFGIKEARKVFVAAVRHNPKLVKESNDLVEHVCEASDIEFDMFSESYMF